MAPTELQSKLMNIAGRHGFATQWGEDGKVFLRVRYVVQSTGHRGYCWITVRDVRSLLIAMGY